MKSIISFIKQSAVITPLLALMLILVSKQTLASETITKTYSVNAYSRLTVSSAFEVEFIHSNEKKVIIEIDKAAADNVYVGNQGDNLIIKMKDYTKRNTGTMSAKVYGPSLTGVTVSGASSFKSDHTFTETDFTLNASGASSVDISVNTQSLTTELSGASKVSVTGSADHLKIESSGASHFQGKKCKSKTASATASGASKIVIDCSDSLDAIASGASDITYLSEPKTIKKKTSGASDISLH
jgi:hypothetical protein